VSGYNGLPTSFPIVFPTGDDMLFTLVVTMAGGPRDMSEAVITAPLVGAGLTTVTDLNVVVTDNQIEISLSSIESAALGAWNGHWYLQVVEDGITNRWLAGPFITNSTDARDISPIMFRSDFTVSIGADVATVINLNGVLSPGIESGSIAYVMVVTGDETRPDTPNPVFWIGGEDQPANIITGDVWLSEGDPPAATPPTVTTTSLSTMTDNEAFSQTLAATGSTPITWAVTTGSVPAGLSLSSGGGLSGTPTTPGAYSFTVTATNSAGSDTQSYSGTVEEAGPGPRFFFDGIVPDTDVISSEGGGSLYTAQWYGTVPFTVLGARIWNAPAADGTFLATDVTVYAYARDSLTGDDMPAPTFGSPTQSKAHTATRTAGTWTEVYFDTPIEINAFAVGANDPDTICIAIQYAGGNYFTTLTDTFVASSAAIESVHDDNIFFPAHSYRRSYNSLGIAVTTWYGIDLIYQLA
jgi:hypothetical protein